LPGSIADGVSREKDYSLSLNIVGMVRLCFNGRLVVFGLAMYRLKIDPEVISKFPDYGCAAAFATGLVNCASADSSRDLANRLGEVCEGIRERFESVRPESEPHIAAWRNAYRSFGAKPKKHHCSVEALIGRILESGGLRDNGLIVNAYNLISLQHMIPIGGEDWGKLASDNILSFSNGRMPFEIRRGGELVVETPPVGEVVWADSKGITCRRWNWRQCDRTAITEGTTDAYFVFDVLPPFGLTNALLAAEALRDVLLPFSPNLSYEIEVIQSPKI
jgi:DNA/RNA-binding domain of Phe-tRNA-synthetase-like protein